jgi:hypothetical protein
LTLSNTSTSLTWAAKLTFSILLHHHTSKLATYLKSTFWSVQVSAPYNIMILMYHLSDFLFKFTCNLQGKKVLFLLTFSISLCVNNIHYRFEEGNLHQKHVRRRSSSNMYCTFIFVVECCFRHDNFGFNFTCTSCIICYYANQIVEILYIYIYKSSTCFGPCRPSSGSNSLQTPKLMI